MITKKILFTSNDLIELKKLHETTDDKIITYKKQEFDRDYLKYLIQFLEFKGL